MASDFPSSKKTFSQLVDGTDYMEATQVNQAYDEIEAIETFLGSMGRSQSYSASLKNALIDYISGCEVEYKSATELYVRSGEICITSAAGNYCYRRNTSDTTVTWADIDTGSEAASTRYYVYAIADTAATTFTIKISTNASIPSGSPVYYRKIGSFYNNSDSDISDVNDVEKLKHHETGEMCPWPSDTVPDGAVLCDGTAYNGTADPTFADLFGVIGNTFGGSDITDFQVPDLRGRTPIGQDDMGGSSANRVTDANADTLGGTDGSENHTLSAAESGVKSHGHQFRYQTGNGGGSGYMKSPYGAQSSYDTEVNDSVVDHAGDGASSAHNNMQPYMALNYIIWK